VAGALRAEPGPGAADIAELMAREG
jgi:hypothetical protein